jgi:hypothetical protein
VPRCSVTTKSTGTERDVVPHRGVEHAPLAVAERHELRLVAPLPLLPGSENAVASTVMFFPGPRSRA